MTQASLRFQEKQKVTGEDFFPVQMRNQGVEMHYGFELKHLESTSSEENTAYFSAKHLK